MQYVLSLLHNKQMERDLGKVSSIENIIRVDWTTLPYKCS